MKINKGNLWTYPADFKIVTTNGIIKKDGKLVMGAGIALEAKKRYKGIDKWLGRLVKNHGNHVFLYYNILSFPTKHNWKDKSDLKLIEQSCQEVLTLVNSFIDKEKTIVLSPVGCGHGGLNFETQVKPLLEKYLDDRFVVLL